jgi:hypothetical protein
MVAQLLAVRIWHWLAKYCFAIANFFLLTRHLATLRAHSLYPAFVWSSCIFDQSKISANALSKSSAKPLKNAKFVKTRFFYLLRFVASIRSSSSELSD